MQPRHAPAAFRVAARPAAARESLVVMSLTP
jgi:hypothetical protein